MGCESNMNGLVHVHFIGLVEFDSCLGCELSLPHLHMGLQVFSLGSSAHTLLAQHTGQDPNSYNDNQVYHPHDLSSSIRV